METSITPNEPQITPEVTPQQAAPQVIPSTPVTQEETAEARYQRLYSAQPPQSTDPVQAELAALRQELAQLRSPAPSQPAMSPVSEAAWVEKIRQGDFLGAQQVIADEVRKSLSSDFEKVQQEAFSRAQAAASLQNEVERYLTQVRSTNPELVHFERYLEAPVAQRVEAAKAAGKIKSTADYLAVYKAAVDAEVESLRNLGLQFRAAGKAEATTRTRDVLASTPLQPNQVTLSNQPSSDGTPRVESTEDYFTRRKADEARRKGLSF